MSQNSTRNHLPGTIKEITSDTVVSEVLIETSAGMISSVITTRAVKSLGLKVGETVEAVIKATNVSVRRPAE